MVASASIALGDRQHGNAFYFFERQILAAADGSCRRLVHGEDSDPDLAAASAPWLAGVAILLLVMVLVPGLGRTANGSTRWLNIAGFNIMQVSEPVRLMLLIYVADYAVRRNQEIRSSFFGFMKPLADRRCRRGPAARAAGLRLGRTAARHFLHHPVHRRCPPAGCESSRSGPVVLGFCGARQVLALSHEAPHRFLGSLGRSLRRRLPADPVTDRDRQRRMDRPRSGRQRAEALLSAGGAHRLHLRRDRRGVRPARQPGDDPAVRAADLAGVRDRARGCRRASSFSRPTSPSAWASGWRCRRPSISA